MFPSLACHHELNPSDVDIDLFFCAVDACMSLILPQEMFKLVSAGVFVNEKPMPHMAKRSPMLKKAINTPGMPFCFIVTWLIPGPPHYTVSQVFVRAIPEGQDPKFDKLFKIFSSGEDDVACRKARFKFIPNIVKCPFLVSAALRTLGGMRYVCYLLSRARFWFGLLLLFRTTHVNLLVFHVQPCDHWQQT